MRRSSQVTAPLLAATALSLLTGCRQMQRCVNENNQVIDDSFCKDQPDQTQNSTMPHPIYRYYYGGSGGYGLGTTVSGGSFSPSPGVSYVTRGGFGSSFAEGGSHASGSGEGGGHGGGSGE
jgi:hypothetical protein